MTLFSLTCQKYTVVFLLSFLLCHASCNHDSKSPIINTVSSNSSQELVPQKVSKYLEASFPNWKIAEKSDYIKSWWSFYDKSTLPYFVTTDLNDDNYVDYGFILKNSDSIKVVVITGNSQGFNHWVVPGFHQIFNSQKHDLHTGLTLEPPGRIDIAYPEIKSLILKSNAINMMDYENRTHVYYWTSEGFKIFKTN